MVPIPIWYHFSVFLYLDMKRAVNIEHCNASVIKCSHSYSTYSIFVAKLTSEFSYWAILWWNWELSQVGQSVYWHAHGVWTSVAQIVLCVRKPKNQGVVCMVHSRKLINWYTAFNIERKLWYEHGWKIACVCNRCRNRVRLFSLVYYKCRRITDRSANKKKLLRHIGNPVL